MAELEHVQEPEADLAAATGAQERLAVLDPAVPQRLVDQKALAVVAVQRLDPLPLDRAEEELVVASAVRSGR